VKQKPPTALVVDDDDMVREFMSLLLERNGFRVLQARNGLEALQVFGSYHSGIALIVTDIEMPVMGGLEALGRMREIDSTQAVLAVSGRADELAPKAPDIRCLPKPFSPAHFNEYVGLVMKDPRAKPPL
jgi:CheY-like chemotaxis protein